MARREKQPPGLKLAGRRLWDSVLADFELDQHERDLLLQAAQTLDIIDALQAVIERKGVVEAHRELVEARQQRLAYARLITAMRMPAGMTGDRPQRRGIRGVYSGTAGA